MKKRSLFFTVLFTSILSVILALKGSPIIDRIDWHYKKEHYLKEVDDLTAQFPRHREDKIAPHFRQEGLDNIALIMMIKDEEDVILENLLWHFAVGFRKFVIVDNLSTDGTQEKLNQFKNLTKDCAKVFVIEDPIFEYIQSRITTGAYDFARSVWPELEWVFPVDADEFITPKKDLKEVLARVPKLASAISVPRIQYHPTEDYDTFASDAPFYEKMYHRLPMPSLAENFEYVNGRPAYLLGKVVVRSQDNIIIAQGNHSITKKKLRLNKTPEQKRVIYTDGVLVGLSIYEFPLRSVAHAHKKYLNGMKANLRAKELGMIRKNHGTHWDAYQNYIDHYGEEGAAEKMFKESFRDRAVLLNEPFPLKKAIEHTYKIVHKEQKAPSDNVQ